MHDYYASLRIRRTATAEEIKAAHRLRVKETYPGYGANEADDSGEFLQVQDAYEVLSDPIQRADYDSSLPSTAMIVVPEAATPVTPPLNARERYEAKYGLYTGERSSDFPGPALKPKPKSWKQYTDVPGPTAKPEPIKVRWSKSDKENQDSGYVAVISLKQSYEGLRVDISKRREIDCPLCKGKRFTVGDGAACPVCDGSGEAGERNFFAKLIFGDPCKNCEGRGKIQIPKDCYCGNGMSWKIDENKTHLVRGIADGSVVSVPDGDTLLVHVLDMDGTGFVRNGDDLSVTKDVTVTQLKKGISFKIKCLDGAARSVTVPAGSVEDFEITFPHCGMPKANSREFGDLTVKLRLRVPGNSDSKNSGDRSNAVVPNP